LQNEAEGLSATPANLELLILSRQCANFWYLECSGRRLEG
jgi:hypothetical protein